LPVDTMANKKSRPTKAEIKIEARAWAEFLYDEFRIEQNRNRNLLKAKKDRKMKRLTNHDKSSKT